MVEKVSMPAEMEIDEYNDPVNKERQDLIINQQKIKSSNQVQKAQRRAEKKQQLKKMESLEK